MEKKILGLIILFISYLSAIFIGYIFYKIFENYISNMIVNIFIANIISTIYIWLVGTCLKTASIYDPYWSVQTVVIAIFLMIKSNNFSVGVVIYLVPILFWSIRLTYNFITTFHDLSYIDWRYKMLKEKTKLFYPFVNLLGIHMIPTMIVFVASLPLFIYILNDINFSWLNIIGMLIMIFAVIIELISDKNMHKFIKNRKSRSEVNKEGLWGISRHPNYFGEITFWYGFALFLILSNFSYFYLIIGAILNNCLFLFISIPMAEKHMIKYKPDFINYKKEVRMLIPIKK